MMHKSKSNPAFNSPASKNRMIKSNSYTSISTIPLNEDNIAWTMKDVEHVSPFIPISNVAKCMATHTFPIAILSSSDEEKSAVDLSLCLTEPGYAEKKNIIEIEIEKCVEDFKNKITRNRSRKRAILSIN
jgi:hypothetical protein